MVGEWETNVNTLMNLTHRFYKQLMERTKVHKRRKCNVGTHDVDMLTYYHVWRIYFQLLGFEILIMKEKPSSSKLHQKGFDL